MKYVQKFLGGYLVHEKGDELFHANSFLEYIIKLPFYIIACSLLGLVFVYIMLGIAYVLLQIAPPIIRFLASLNL